VPKVTLETEVSHNAVKTQNGKYISNKPSYLDILNIPMRQPA